MCATCGCTDDDAGVRVVDPRTTRAGHGFDHSEHGHGRHDHGHHGHGGGDGHDHQRVPDDHGHAAGPGHRTEPGSEVCGVETDTRTVSLEVDVLAKNDALADRNRRWLAEHGVVALNLMSSPGSGKTTLLERTITDLGAGIPCAVLEGDQETLIDADRIEATGARAIQINTGAGCHLDADMVLRGLRTLNPEQGSWVFVENVGNLVCPALFDLGESARVVIISVTEGADKPLKYPHMFRTADLVLINKVDLLPYVDFDVGACAGHIRRAAPGAEILQVSATRGDGLDDWYAWLRVRTGPASAG